MGNIIFFMKMDLLVGLATPPLHHTSIHLGQEVQGAGFPSHRCSPQGIGTTMGAKQIWLTMLNHQLFFLNNNRYFPSLKWPGMGAYRFSSTPTCLGLDMAYLNHQSSRDQQSQVAFGRASSVGTAGGLADGVDASESS